jgi:hypothetical protein
VAEEIALIMGTAFFSVEHQMTFGVSLLVLPANPKGIGAFSPGLRGTKLPWGRIQKMPNPERVAERLARTWYSTLSGLRS